MNKNEKNAIIGKCLENSKTSCQCSNSICERESETHVFKNDFETLGEWF